VLEVGVGDGLERVHGDGGAVGGDGVGRGGAGHCQCVGAAGRGDGEGAAHAGGGGGGVRTGAGGRGRLRTGRGVGEVVWPGAAIDRQGSTVGVSVECFDTGEVYGTKASLGYRTGPKVHRDGAAAAREVERIRGAGVAAIDEDALAEAGGEGV